MIIGVFVVFYSVGINLVVGINRGGIFVIIFILGGFNYLKFCVIVIGVVFGSVGINLVIGVCNIFINV